MNVRQYIPAFVDGVVPEQAEVTNVAQLLALDWIDSWTKTVGFYRFTQTVSLQPANPLGVAHALLMAEFDQGNRWYVVAILDRDLEGLPYSEFDG